MRDLAAAGTPADAATEAIRSFGPLTKRFERLKDRLARVARQQGLLD